MTTALVLGAGISGLAAAHALRSRGEEVVVLEAGTRVGGCLHTVREAGYTVELGASTVRASPELAALCRQGDCSGRLLRPSPQAHRRYVVRHGTLVPLPTAPPGILTTPLLSVAGRLRLLSEPWRARGPCDPAEPFANFVRRRLGPQALPLADAMVQGIYAGDPHELAVGYAFPTLWGLVERHGSLLRGLRSARAAIARQGDQAENHSTGLIGFAGGFEALAQQLASGLDVRLHHRVRSISAGTPGTPRFRVEVESPAGGSTQLTTDRLVVALPASPTARLLAPLGATASIAALPHAPVAVVALGYARDQIAHPLDGFGFLAPRSEGRTALGGLFSSSLFADRAPAGYCLVKVMIGGRGQEELLDLDDAALTDRAHRELVALLGATGAPTLSIVERWRPGIPQPTAAWRQAGACAAALETAHPGLTVLGTWRHGVGVPDCVKAAAALATTEPTGEPES